MQETEKLPTASGIINRFDFMLRDVCSEIKEIQRFQFKFRDVFSMKMAYDLMANWFQENKYGFQHPFEAGNEPGKIDKIHSERNFPETQYLHKEWPDGTEIWLRWRLQKELPEYPHWAFQIDVDMHILFLKPTEVVINGKKVKADKGEIEVTAVGFVMTDFKRRIKDHPFLKHFYNFFFNVVHRDTIEHLEQDMRDEINNFRTALKEYFKLPTYSDIDKASRYWVRRDNST